MVINGVLDAEKNKVCSGPVRKSLRQQKVCQPEVEKWLASLAEISEVMERHMETRVREVIGTLHDVKTAVNLVYRNAEALVQKYPGSTFDERVEGTEPELKSLLKSVGLLTTRFITSSIVANPESVRHGKKRPCPVYKVFHKMVRLFQEVANRKHVHIQMSGASFKTPQVYDSFEALALVLVDNAIKYSESGQQVTVTVDDQGDGVYVSVESHGHTIAQDEQERVFEKGYRTSEAIRSVRDGSGLGLHIARLIADAHQTKVWYKARNVGTDGMGTNIFSVKIPG